MLCRIFFLNCLVCIPIIPICACSCLFYQPFSARILLYIIIEMIMYAFHTLLGSVFSESTASPRVLHWGLQAKLPLWS